MAIKDVVQHYNKLVKEQRAQIGKLSGLGDNVVLDISMGGKPFVDAIRKGTKEIISANQMNKRANAVEHWNEAVKIAITEIKSTGRCGVNLKAWNNTIENKGVYLVSDKRRKNSILVRFIKVKSNSIANDSSVAKVAKGFRDLVYDKWVDVVASAKLDLFSGKAMSRDSSMPYTDSKGKKGTKKISLQLGQNTNVSHQSGTTIAELAVKNLRESKPTVNTPLTTHVLNVFDFAEQNMSISWGRKSHKGSFGKYKYTTTVKASLEYNKKGSKLTSDTTGMLNKFERATREYIKKEIMKPGSTLYGLTMTASKSIKQQIIEDTIQDIAIPLTKSGRPDRRFKVVKKLTAKQFKAETRAPKEVKQSKSSPTIQAAIALVAAGKLARGKPEKTKRGKSNNLLKLTKQINKRLPAQVRRDMGRPALINQTGKFSNSVTLRKLKETPNGLTGDYTYMLTGGGTSKNRTGVYETFEGTGSKNWPKGYNPKMLITKSIRKLAIQYTEEKLTSLRRV